MILTHAHQMKGSFNMNITYETLDDQMTVKLTGEIDHHNAKLTREKIDTAIKSESPKKLILDMSAITFCDSSGLGLIMGRYKIMNENGGELYINSPTKSVEKIIRLSGLDKLVKIID